LGGLATSASVTLYLSANDNESTVSDNSSSGWKEVKYSYYMTRVTSGTTAPASSQVTTDWLSFTDNLSTASDNYSFDNASFTLTLSSTSGIFDNTSSSADNLTVIAWLRDNASNMSDNITTVFSLDNSTIYYDRTGSR